MSMTEWSGTKAPAFKANTQALAELMINGLIDADRNYRTELGNADNSEYLRETALSGYINSVCGPAIVREMYTLLSKHAWDEHEAYYRKHAYVVALEVICDLIVCRVNDSARD